MTAAPPSPQLPLEPQMAPTSSEPSRVGRKAATKAERDKSREKVIFVCIGVVTAALAAMLYVQFGYSISASVLLGGVAWFAFMLLHEQFRKRDQIAALKEDVNRLQAELHRVQVGDDLAPAGDPTLARAARSAPRTPSPRQAATDTSPPSPQDIAAPLRLDPKARWEQTNTKASPRNRQQTEGGKRPAAEVAAAPVPTVHDATLWPGTSVSAADPMRDAWAFKPPAGTSAPPASSPQRSAPPVMPASAVASSIDADLELVQRKIRALADEVNTAEAMKALAEPVSPEAMPEVLEQTIGALKDTASVMRERPAPSSPAGRVSVDAATKLGSEQSGLPADLFIPNTARTIASTEVEPEPAVQPSEVQSPSISGAGAMAFDPDAFEMLARAAAPPPPPVSPHVAALTEAVERGQMDVFLSPIVGLETYDVRHYEVSVRLKSEQGTYLVDQEETLDLAGPAILALFDAARLTRAAIVADRLDARGKSGSLLSQVSGASMTDGEFLETFARVYEQRGTISNQLVLTFNQRDIENMPTSAWQALSDMHAFGFRFALDNVEHLSTDFVDLARRGFAFVKLPASAFLQGLPARTHFAAPNEVCKQLAGAGLTLIVGTIDQEDVRARVFGFGAILGQGQLFGGARHVSLDPTPRGNRSEAA